MRPAARRGSTATKRIPVALTLWRGLRVHSYRWDLDPAGVCESLQQGSGDRFGISVALVRRYSGRGGTQESSCATGINGDQETWRPECGAVYVFTRTGGVWSQQAYMKASKRGRGTSLAGAWRCLATRWRWGHRARRAAPRGSTAIKRITAAFPPARSMCSRVPMGSGVSRRISRPPTPRRMNLAGASLSGDTLAVGAIDRGELRHGDQRRSNE